jgi:hypothetical protein
MYGTLRDYHFSDQAEDIRGSAIYGINDEKLGKVDDVIFDQNTGRILVPADRLSAYEREEGGFLVNLTKAQIEKFPTFNEDVISSEDRVRRKTRKRSPGFDTADSIRSHGMSVRIDSTSHIGGDQYETDHWNGSEE